LNKANFYYQKR